MSQEPYYPQLNVHVISGDRQPVRGYVPCRVGDQIRFNPDVLQSYQTDAWQPVLFDVLLLAAAVEFCDMSRRRSIVDWSRNFSVRLPVHDLELWNRPEVSSRLVSALKYVTGDDWSFSFEKAKNTNYGPRQKSLALPAEVSAVIPFSDGLDSRAVAEIVGRRLPHELLRVRLGSKRIAGGRDARLRQPFENVPFSVRPLNDKSVDSSRRSRGFKFAALGALAAYLVRSSTVVVPESGQGALGPALVNVGQAFPDRRSYPVFTGLMAEFFNSLLGAQLEFEHPMIWGTKGATLAAYRNLVPGDAIWRETRSCWHQSRSASVHKELRQCGICAACMLRRLSLHAAGYREDDANYVWEDLGADEFWEGAAEGFRKTENYNSHHLDYAIAGTLHLDHLALLPDTPAFGVSVERHALQLARAMGISCEEAADRMQRMIYQHATEWRDFLGQLPKSSFVRNWAQSV